MFPKISTSERGSFFSSIWLVDILLCIMSIIIMADGQFTDFQRQELLLIPFIAILVFYFPSKSSDKNAKYLFLGAALAFRLLLISHLPINYTDFYRNLMYGDIFIQGYNPYLITGNDILTLLKSGSLSLQVPYIGEWGTHAFDYPSLAIYFFGIILYLSQQLIVNPVFLGKILFSSIDFANAYLIYKILTLIGIKKEMAEKSAFLYLLNPIGLYQITVEGQFEGVVMFFVLLSLYFATYATSKLQNQKRMNKKVIVVTAIFLAASALLKYYTMIFTPFIIWQILQRPYRSYENIRNTALFLITCAVTISIFSAPFIFTSDYIIHFIVFQYYRNDFLLNTATIHFFDLEVILLPIMVLISIIPLVILVKTKEWVMMPFLLANIVLIAFLFALRSFFPWYLIWLLNFTPLIASNREPFITTFPWIAYSLLFIAGWGTIPEILPLILAITSIGYVVTNKALISSCKNYIGSKNNVTNQTEGEF